MLEYENRNRLKLIFTDRMWLLCVAGIFLLILSPILIPILYIFIYYKEIWEDIKQYFNETFLAIFMRYK